MRIKQTFFLVVALVGCLAAQDSVTPLFPNLLGGSVRFSSSSIGDTDDQTLFAFTPSFGRQVSSNWIVGLAVGLSWEQRTGSFFFQPVPGPIQETETSNNIVSLQVFSRYLINPAGRFYGFLQPEVGFGFGNLTTDFLNNPQASTETRTRSFSLQVRPGVGYAIAPKWRLLAFLGGFGYNSFSQKPDGADDFSTVTSNIFFNADISSIQFAAEFRF